MQTRRLEIEIRALLKRYPAIAILGPRQVGKTTLAKHLGGAYFDLEQVGARTALDVDWIRLCAGEKLVILDEAQAWPEIFPRLRGAIDDDRKRNGRFVLLGSVVPSLMREVSESLAGRLALVELTPFLLPEVVESTEDSGDTSTLGESAIDRSWLRGGFPDGGILEASAFPRWQRDFVALLTQRDLPKWGSLRALETPSDCFTCSPPIMGKRSTPRDSVRASEFPLRRSLVTWTSWKVRT